MFSAWKAAPRSASALSTAGAYWVSRAFCKPSESLARESGRIVDWAICSAAAQSAVKASTVAGSAAVGRYCAR